jgi:hypothetical protein
MALSTETDWQLSITQLHNKHIEDILIFPVEENAPFLGESRSFYSVIKLQVLYFTLSQHKTLEAEPSNKTSLYKMN